MEKEDSKRAKSSGENKIISFLFFFKNSGPSLAGLGARESLNEPCVYSPPLPAPRCPALLVVGDSSPAVDAVVCKNRH